MKVPQVPTVMLAVMGLFQAVAALGTWIPSFIDDRVVEQFIPVWTLVLRPIQGETPREPLVRALAYSSQFLIGTSEVVIAIALLGAAFAPRRRLVWANFGLTLSTGLFGAFMITMFAVDDKVLPKWHMYLGVLTWIGVTWLIVAFDRQRS
jgi:hypothetical protein